MRVINMCWLQTFKITSIILTMAAICTSLSLSFSWNWGKFCIFRLCRESSSIQWWGLRHFYLLYCCWPWNSWILRYCPSSFPLTFILTSNLLDWIEVSYPPPLRLSRSRFQDRHSWMSECSLFPPALTPHI